MPLGMFVDLLSQCIGTAQRGTTFWLVGSTLKLGDSAQVPLNPAIIQLVRLETGGSCDLGNLGWTILALTRTAQGHCYLADLGGFVPVHTRYRTGYNRCGPWTPPLFVSLPTCPSGSIRNRRERRGGGSSVRQDVVPQASSLSRRLLISPQGIARDLGLTQPHLSYSQVISGV